MALIGKHNINRSSSSPVVKYEKGMKLRTGDFIIRKDGVIGVFLGEDFIRKNARKTIDKWFSTLNPFDLRHGIFVFACKDPDFYGRTSLTYLTGEALSRPTLDDNLRPKCVILKSFDADDFIAKDRQDAMQLILDRSIDILMPLALISY